MVDLPVANNPVELVDILFLTLHLNLFNGQFPFDLDFIVQFVLLVLVGLESVKVDLG